MKQTRRVADCGVKQNGFSRILFHCLFTLLFLCLFLFRLSAGHTAEITLSWDPNTETDIAGYKVFSGTSSGNYAGSMDVGNWNSCTVSGLQEGKTYYYAAKAYNTARLESGYSNEVSYNTPTPINNPPTVTTTSPTNGASFTTDEMINFTGTASDKEDGTLTSNLVWTSNINGKIGTGGSFSANLSAGTHSITATATDSKGAAGSAAITLTVAPGGITSMSVKAYRVRTYKYAALTWSPSTTVDVYRNGAKVITTTNSGTTYTDGPLGKRVVSATATYKVCKAGTSTCSSIVTATW